MQITDIRVKRIAQEGKLRGIVSVTFDDVLALHDIKVIEGNNGMFISMPSRKMASGEFKDIAHPINQDMRTYLQDEIIKAYNASVDVIEA